MNHVLRDQQFQEVTIQWWLEVNEGDIELHCGRGGDDDNLICYISDSGYLRTITGLPDNLGFILDDNGAIKVEQ